MKRFVIGAPEALEEEKTRQKAGENASALEEGKQDGADSEETTQMEFADACWVAEDITSNYDCTTEQAEQWLQEIDCKLRDFMIETGWEYIDLTCPFERKDDEDENDE